MRINWNLYKVNQLIKSCLQACFSLFNEKSFHLLIFGFVIGLLLSQFYTLPHKKISKHQNQTQNKLFKNIDIINTTNHINETLEHKLYNEVKILCWVMTNPNNHQIKVVNILKTWGKRCNKLIVISSKEDKKLGIIRVPVGEGRKQLWAKTREALKYIYKHYLDEYDWIFRADDDTYVIVDNARLMLYEYDPRTPIYFGFKYSAYVKQGYMSGGGGYVMSKEALKRFIEIALPNQTICATWLTEADDVEIGKCLENVGVMAGDSRDIDNRGRFFICPPEVHLLNENIDLKYWYWIAMYYKTFEGLNCCSDYAITFHYVFGQATEILHYLIYHAKPYGIKMNPRKLPENKIYIRREIPHQKID